MSRTPGRSFALAAVAAEFVVTIACGWVAIGLAVGVAPGCGGPEKPASSPPMAGSAVILPSPVSAEFVPKGGPPGPQLVPKVDSPADAAVDSK